MHKQQEYEYRDRKSNICFAVQDCSINTCLRIYTCDKKRILLIWINADFMSCVESHIELNAVSHFIKSNPTLKDTSVFG